MNRRALTGIVTGALSLSVLAQDVDPRTGKPTEPKKAAEEKAPEAKAVVPTAPAKPAAPDLFPAPADVAAAPTDAIKSESGLASKVIKAGTGKEMPTANDGVVAHYTGWKASDGSMFDSSRRRGAPTPFPLDSVIAGWTEGLQLMVVGEQRRFWIPEDLAYKGQPGQPEGMLVFDVELVEINKGPGTPENFTAPEDAVKAESGLASKVLTKGTGDQKPGATDVVKINFFAWDSKGKRVMAPSLQGQAVQEIPLTQMPVKGLVQGIQEMVAGEKRRLWIPKELAFQRGPESEAMIMDVELISFTPDPNAAPEGVLIAPADAQKTESGIATLVLKASESKEMPTADDIVKIAFKGWNASGRYLGGSDDQGRPLDVPVSKAPIKAWTEILPLMKKGEKRRLWIPAAQGFAQQRPGAPAEDLVFEIEILEITKGQPAPEAPADVAAPPADAQKTESGLASKVLAKGIGDKNPGATTKVTVHYSGWTTDGKMFDSSVQRGKPSSFALNGVIAGWTEGLQLMVEGEKRRFWIPEALAYKGQPGRPAGMLVFDVELISIDN